ncbi:glycoside hydrolase family 31 protein [Chitinophaga sp. GbtcB8]|uniref:glycoside hydrolase family 31 protein n=1 Tax=Chitinophaga sp. GbtcB8 TaxID=2824753 RepID=UPI001C305E41|nr:TIM-barrel domain-containing protein [Chitinophaga sp. GbtcB8]
MFRTIITLCTAFCIGSLAAQAQVGSYQQDFSRKGNIFYFTTTQARVQLEFCTAAMFRVRMSRSGTFAPDEPWMVVQYQWGELPVQATETGEAFRFSTAALQIVVNKKPFNINVYTADGKLLSEEPADGAVLSGDTTLCRKTLQPDEHFFGFGERMDFLDRRGKKLQLNVGRGAGMPHITGAYNVLAANYSPIPFFMSTRGYGIFLHTSAATEWDMGSTRPDQYTFAAQGKGELDYYFIYGPRFAGILEQYTALTGRSPLMPLFAMGLHVGTYSGGTWGHEQLTSAAYVLALARRFRELGIPVDLLFLDSTWRLFGKNGGKGATSFEWRETFHNPRAMMDSLYALHYNMVGLHIRPRLDNGLHNHLLDSAAALGYTYPENGRPGEFVNFFDSTAVSWWWQNAAMKVARIGAKFFKTDEGSAFGHLANESNKTGPTDEKARALHNVFPIAYAKAAYENFAAYNHLRGMNHTREGYAGIQRYPFIFAGDWPSEWQYFEPVIKAGLNIGLSGVGYWAHCMGGFEHPADPELYIRWCQFGMLSPVAMVFGMDHPGYKEPWNYGKEAQVIFKQYARLRYQLLPYLYNHAYEMYTTGMPLMRALVLDYQDDVNVYNITDQYLLGSSLMVCPVTQKGAATRTVYLPQGRWIDYWTGKTYPGKQYLNVLTPLDKIPLFIKAGSIIPTQAPLQYVGERIIDTLTLDIYPGDSASCRLYTDDGKSLLYQQGQFAITSIHSQTSEDNIAITIQPAAGPYHSPLKTFELKVHLAEKPKAVTAAKWQYDAAAKVLYVRDVPAGAENRITIQGNYQ